jgi:hypothetical protein
MYSFLQKILTNYYVSKARFLCTAFSVAGKKHNYFCHRYNATWKNERAVEVPYVWAAVQKAHAQGLSVLEIGNVLSHYFPITHEVVDKYEKAPGVINKDIVGFKPHKKYDLIVSISTLEHVGWDETPKDKLKIKKAITAIKNMLKKNGKAIVTIPLGYNPPLDILLKNKAITFDETYYLRRTSELNSWEQTSNAIVGKMTYGKPFSNANGLIIGILYT